MKWLISRDGGWGSVIVGQWGEGPEKVLNIVIFLQLHNGAGRTVPQRRDVKTTNTAAIPTNNNKGLGIKNPSSRHLTN